MALYYITTKSVSKNAKIKGAKSVNQYMYITRQGQYSGADDIRYSAEGNLPDCPDIKTMKDYWQAADESVRKNGRIYRKIIIALQEEFPLEQNIELVNKLLDHFGIRQNQTYCYAIHDKPASYDPKHRNIHAHVMFNERILNPNRHFKNKKEIFSRYRGLQKQDTEGGLKIDRYFNRPDFVKGMRSYWEKINNEKFLELGIDKKISSKSLKDQRADLEKQGMYEEAEKLNRRPGKHLGPGAKNPYVQKEIMDEVKKEVNAELQKMDDLQKEAQNNILCSLKDNDIIYRELYEQDDIIFGKTSKTRCLTRSQLEELIEDHDEIEDDYEPNYYTDPDEIQKNEMPPVDQYSIPVEETYSREERKPTKSKNKFPNNTDEFYGNEPSASPADEMGITNFFEDAENIPLPPFDENNEDIAEKERIQRRKNVQEANRLEDRDMDLSAEEMKKELRQSVISKDTFDKLVNQEFKKLYNQYLKNKDDSVQLNLDDPNLTPDEKIKLTTKAIFETKKKIFVKNKVIKKIGEIEQLYRSEQQKKRYQRSMAILKKHGFDNNIMTDGIVLTVKDTTKAMTNLIASKQKKIEDLQDKIKDRTSKIILDPKEIDQIATEKVTQNKDKKLIVEIEKLQSQIKETQKITKSPIRNIKEYNQKCDEEDILKQQLKNKKQELEAWQIEYNKTMKKEIMIFKGEIEQQNKEIRFRNRKDREAIDQLLLEVNLLNKKRVELEKNLPPDTILYGEKIPTRVLLTCKINGKQLKQMPFVIMANKPYTIINKPQKFEYGEKIKLECLKLGDATDNGKAQIYEAEVIITQQKIPNTQVIVPKYTAVKIDPTDKKVPLYTVNNPKVIKEYENLTKAKSKTIGSVAPTQTAHQRAGNALSNIISNALKPETAKLGKLSQDEKSEYQKKLETATNELEVLAAQENEALENGDWAKSMRFRFGRSR